MRAASLSSPQALEPFKGKCIVLNTSYVSNPLAIVAWRKLETQLQAQNISFEVIDGAGMPQTCVGSAQLKQRPLQDKLQESIAHKDQPAQTAETRIPRLASRMHIARALRRRPRHPFFPRTPLSSFLPPTLPQSTNSQNVDIR